MIKTDCVHHWMIDTPDGPTSHGRCERCGEGREFPNWIEGTYNFDTPVEGDEEDHLAPPKRRSGGILAKRKS